ncbi:uncharacterized protein LOC142221437 isoform X1 [Haematobia irritans]|uniref:uncharacterized protein LOC142221437 isoform X1 n=1 Tax=Haematobia irritans TaxID=7368 RepID=UPI003F5063DC
MVREELVGQLKQMGIDFPETATIAQLRELLKDVVGANAVQPQNNIDATKQANQETEKNLDMVEKQLQAKLRILKLQNEINELERKEEKKGLASFGDIEGALPKFTGDDEYGVVKWVAEFEKVTNVVGCAAAEKFLFARRMMAGSAALFLRNTKANNWPSLKEELCAEFEKTVGAKDTLKKLDSRKWNMKIALTRKKKNKRNLIPDNTPNQLLIPV